MKRKMLWIFGAVLLGFLLGNTIRGASAAAQPADVLSAFTIVVNAIVNLFGQAVLAILQAFATALQHL